MDVYHVDIDDPVPRPEQHIHNSGNNVSLITRGNPRQIQTQALNKLGFERTGRRLRKTGSGPFVVKTAAERGANSLSFSSLNLQPQNLNQGNPNQPEKESLKSRF